MRENRGGIVRAVVAAFLLPLLLNILPALPVSAAAALERDTVLSVCGRDMQQSLPGGESHAGHDHCIMAGSACAACAPSALASASAFAAAPLNLQRVPALSRVLLPPRHAEALLKGSPPRGPPSLLLI